MFILDTNVISALRRPQKADPNVLAWAASTPVAQTYLSAITILEIELGQQLMERKDRVHARALRNWIDRVILPRYDGRILAVDTAVAQRCARLHVPDPRSERDALIAATGLVHAMAVVTRNVSDFQSSGVAVVNPWQ